MPNVLLICQIAGHRLNHSATGTLVWYELNEICNMPDCYGSIQRIDVCDTAGIWHIWATQAGVAN